MAKCSVLSAERRVGMAKAVLVMDMPSSCDVCEFVKESRACDGDLFCNNPLSQQYGCNVTDYVLCRADGCPLRELPEKKDYDYCDRSIWTHERIGYNACIDAICGK